SYYTDRLTRLSRLENRSGRKTGQVRQIPRLVLSPGQVEPIVPVVMDVRALWPVKKPPGGISLTHAAGNIMIVDIGGKAPRPISLEHGVAHARFPPDGGPGPGRLPG